MYTVSFIKHFHIPKDIFEQVCEELPLWYDRLYDGNYDKTEEQYEIPNADIIYTFDTVSYTHLTRSAPSNVVIIPARPTGLTVSNVRDTSVHLSLIHICAKSHLSMPL